MARCSPEGITVSTQLVAVCREGLGELLCERAEGEKCRGWDLLLGALSMLLCVHGSGGVDRICEIWVL